VALHLRPGVRDHYLGWLRGVDPASIDVLTRLKQELAEA